MEGATLADTGGMGEGQKEGAVTMEDGLAEMHGEGGCGVEVETPRVKISPRGSSPLSQPTFKVGAHD